jgi:sigma-B regulation protein RsbU (phosphoserine phosphatase)
MVWHHGSASLQVIGNGGLPIGILKKAGYEVLRLRLDPGSRLYLYSDGITESENSYGVEFGTERLAQLLRREAGAPLEQVKSALESALLEWNPDPAATKDDMTFLALEYAAAHRDQPPVYRA